MTQTATATADGPMLTAAEVCTQLRIGKTKFYELINKGELTAVDINGVEKRRVGEKGPRRSLRVKQAEINRFLRERAVTP